MAREFMPGFLVEVSIAPGADRSTPLVSWPWTDRTDDVRLASGINIEVGSKEERGTVPPGRCTLTFDNTSGDYCRTNPLGQWYGRLTKNTPLRVRVTPTSPEIVDDFGNRTASGGWGYTAGGLVWFSYWSSGSASDFSVASGVGRHSVQANLSHRLSYLPSVQLLDVQVKATVTVAVPTGGVIEPANILLRGQDPTTYYMCRLTVTQTTNAVTATIIRVVGGVETVLGTAGTGLTHAAATALNVRAETLGETIRIRAWQGGAEPGTWAVSVTDNVIATPGWVGIRSGIGSGNTNTKPLVFSYDNVEVLGQHDLFVGDVPEWAPRWDASLVDKTVPIAAAGVLRRLSTGASALHSPAYRALTSAADRPYLVAYWPLEEESGATELSSPIGSPTPSMAGALSLGGYTGHPSAARCVQFGSLGQLGFNIPFYTSSQHKVAALWAVPAAGMAGNRTLMRLHCTGGSLGFIDFTVMADGALQMAALNSGGTAVDTIGPASFAINGLNVMISLEFAETGGNVDVKIFVQYADGRSLQVTDTWPGISIGRLYNISAGQFDNDGVGFGHLAVGNSTSLAFEAFFRSSAATPAGVTGYQGENVTTRLRRIAAEEKLPLILLGTSTVKLGPQPPATQLAIYREGEAADHGLLFEAGGGLAYQTLAHRYLAVDGGVGSEVVLTLDCAQNEVAPPEPVDDDQHLVNDVTVSRDGGGERRYEATGALSPAVVGRYEDDVQLNVATDDVLIQHASTLVAFGTVDDLRWPVIPLVLQGRPALALRWLAASIGSRIQLKNPPPGVGPGPVDLFAEGWSIQIGWNYWTVGMNCSPAAPYRVAVLDGSGNAARLESSGAQLASGVSSSATSWSVKFPAGTPLSITTASNPGDFPFDLNCEGEQIRVTAVSGASSPQTFTVTRAVNGVSKAHLADAAVTLWQPYTPGL